MHCKGPFTAAVEHDVKLGIANQTLMHNNHGFSQILKSDNISQTGQIVTTRS